MAGSGEPTLYSRLGELIGEIKKISDIPVAVITNGSLLWIAEVREQLRNADLVVPSLDAFDEESFAAVNRPAPSITFDKMLNGLKVFRKEFKGKIWLEIFLLDKITSDENAVGKLARLAKEINPDLIQLNTVSRPPTEASVRSVPSEMLEHLKKYFGEKSEIIAKGNFENKSESDKISISVTEQDIMDMVSRHPCTIEEIAIGLTVNMHSVAKIVQDLMGQKKIKMVIVNEKEIYTLPN